MPSYVDTLPTIASGEIRQKIPKIRKFTSGQARARAEWTGQACPLQCPRICGTTCRMPQPRLAVRGLLLLDNRLLLVNAWPPEKNSDLWCAPGGGVDRGQSLPDNLRREFHEETGLDVAVGAPCLVNEFHDPSGSFHQVDIYFHVSLLAGQLSPDWRDPEGVVTRYILASRDALPGLKVKPDSLAQVAWDGAVLYDPLEPLLR